MTWTEFLKRHWELIVAADFFTTDVWTAKGLTRYLVIFFIDLSTRKVAIAGIASRANGLWMSQVGRQVTDAVDGILNCKRFLIHDRDPLFTAEFQELSNGGLMHDRLHVPTKHFRFSGHTGKELLCVLTKDIGYFQPMLHHECGL
jgi:hypothetical protein